MFAPFARAVTPEVGEAGVVIVPPPLNRVQIPAPTVAVLPAKVAVFTHIVWAGPATATVGNGFTVIVKVVPTPGQDAGAGPVGVTVIVAVIGEAVALLAAKAA